MDTWRTGRRTITRTQVKVGYTRTRETRYHGTTPPPERHMALGTKGKTRLASIAFQCPAQRQLHSMHSTFALARFGELTVCYTEVLKVSSHAPALATDMDCDASCCDGKI